MSLPAIGVVIPCYKAEHTLRQTVESVLQGAPDNLQLVLVEDGSPVGTGALCDALPPIRWPPAAMPAPPRWGMRWTRCCLKAATSPPPTPSCSGWM